MSLSFISELSCNHCQDLDTALAIVDGAAKAGATHFKVQVFDAERMAVGKKHHQWGDLRQLYSEALTPFYIVEAIFDYQHEADYKQEVMVSVFHPLDVAACEDEFMSCPNSYKIASFDAVDMDLLDAVGETQRPVFLSTGQVDGVELTRAITRLYQAGCPSVKLMMCRSQYPATVGDYQWGLASSFSSMGHGTWGVSDHTDGSASVVGAALGATIFENHVMLEGTDPLDGEFSLGVNTEYPALIESVKRVHEQLSADHLDPGDTSLRKSLWWARDLPAGHTVTDGDLFVARPNNGTAPYEKDKVIGIVLREPVGRHEEVQVCK